MSEAPSWSQRVEILYEKATQELCSCAEFRAIESGSASRQDYDAFLAGVIKAHLRSPRILAFLFALAPPEGTQDLLHNMLEELGIEEETGESHPSLLRELARGAGLEGRMAELEEGSDLDLRTMIMEPLLYGSLRDVGLAAFAEVVAFEYMLSRVASRIARALAAHRGLDEAALRWFTHHSEVDIAHAQQGMDGLERYIRYYSFDEQDAGTILEMALRENVFIKRYFGAQALARATSMLP